MVASMRSSISKSSLWAVFVILCTLNIWDAATTAILVSKFGSDVEDNPVMRYMIDSYGIMGLYMMKFAVLGFFSLVVLHVLRFYREHRAERTIRYSMWVLNVLLGLIVVNNIILIVNTINI
jgi:hypothetical protein